MHLIALYKIFVVWFCLFAAKCLDIFLQIPAHVFIHDREQKEELLIHILLLKVHTYINRKNIQ